MTTHDSTALDRALRLILAGVVAFCALQILLYDHGRDQGIYALVARSMESGGMPYRDAFDFKPPGIFLLYALARAISGPASWGIRVLEVAGLLATVAAMVSLSERWWQDRTIGWIAAALAALVHAQLDFWHTAQPETFGGMLSILGVWVIRAPREAASASVRGWRLVASGAAFGAAALLKPPLGGGALVVAAWSVVRERRGDTRGARPWLPVLRVGVGGVAPIALCLAWFASRGALADLHDALVVFAPRYTGLGWQGRSFPDLVGVALADWLLDYSSLITAGLLLGLATWRESFRREGVALLGGIVAMHLLGVALQAKFFPYHYGAVWPLTALIAAHGWCRAWRWAARRGRLGALAWGAAAAWCATLVTATHHLPGSWWSRAEERLRLFAGGWRDRPRIDALATVADVDAHQNRLVADWLRARVPRGQSAYIWGFEPVIHDLADVPPASRFLYNVPQRVAWAAARSRTALMHDLDASRPAAIVVESGDVFPFVTGDPRDSRQVLEEDFLDLRLFLDRDYRFDSRIGDFDLFLRTGPEAEPPGPRRAPDPPDAPPAPTG